MIIRILLVPLIVISLFGCTNDSTELDSLFYQISKADSTRCMNEILGEMKADGHQFQIRKTKEIRETCFVACCDCQHESLAFEKDASGKEINSHKLIRENISEIVVDFFMHNRGELNYEWKDEESNSWSPDFPGYSILTKGDIEKEIIRRGKAYKEIEALPGADEVLVEYYRMRAQEVEEWRKMSKVLRTDTLFLVDDFNMVIIQHRESQREFDEIHNQVILGYYHVRNYECMRYFGETYMSLYDRAQRLKRKVDLDKLAVLHFYRPVRVVDSKVSNPHPRPPREIVEN